MNEDGALFLSGVLDYVVREVLDVVGKQTAQITPNQILVNFRKNSNFFSLFIKIL